MSTSPPEDTEPSPAAQAGELLVEARKNLASLKNASDKRLRAAGEAWTASFGAVVKLLQLGSDGPEDEVTLRTLQAVQYALEGGEEIKRFLAEQAVELPPEAAQLAQQLASAIGRARSGDESALASGEDVAQKAQALLDELSS